MYQERFGNVAVSSGNNVSEGRKWVMMMMREIIRQCYW